MDKHGVFLISEDYLRDFLIKYGKGPDSKDYEFVAALYMIENMQKANGGTYTAVFDLKDGRADIRRAFKPSPEETEQIMRNLLKEDTPVDFGLVRGTVDDHEKYALGFQVKRFIGKSVGAFTEDLLKYIEKIANRYRPGEINLVVIAELDGNLEKLKASVNTKRIKDEIIIPQDSFIGIFVLTHDGEKPSLVQIWPKI